MITGPISRRNLINEEIKAPRDWVTRDRAETYTWDRGPEPRLFIGSTALCHESPSPSQIRKMLGQKVHGGRNVEEGISDWLRETA